MTTRALTLDVLDDRVLEVLKAWGTPYSWGAGKPTSEGWPDGVKGLFGGVGYDCSGFAQAALVRLRLLKEGDPDRTAAALFDLGEPVRLEDARLGDLAFYGAYRISHVTVCLGGGVAIGASGGTSKTNADDPKAFVQLQPITYRIDFRGVRRLPS